VQKAQFSPHYGSAEKLLRKCNSDRYMLENRNNGLRNRKPNLKMNSETNQA